MLVAENLEPVWLSCPEASLLHVVGHTPVILLVYSRTEHAELPLDVVLLILGCFEI
jgi:hypothetical protein